MSDHRKINRSNINDLITISKLLSNEDIVKAKKYLLEYQEKYPESTHFIYLSIYARLLGYEGDFDKAIDIYKDILNCDVKTSNNCESLYYLIILLLKSKRYSEAYYYIERINYKELSKLPLKFNTNIKRVYNFLRKELSLDSDIYDLNSYSINQLYCYSDDLAISHIYNKHNFDINNYSFNMDYDSFLELYNSINLSLPLSKITFEYIYGDVYYFKIPNIGINYVDNISSNTLKVITNNNSLEIITMYPVSDLKCSNRNINSFIDESFIEYHSNKKVKKLSQTDKFLRRYNI